MTLAQEIKMLRADLQEAEGNVCDLQAEADFLREHMDDEENTVNDEYALADIAKQLGIVVVPNMPQWALLLEIERSIEKMKKGI